MNKVGKQKLFLILNTLVWCLLGAVCWLVVGDRLIENDIHALSFIGYPGFFLGLIGGLLYLYNRDI